MEILTQNSIACALRDGRAREKDRDETIERWMEKRKKTKRDRRYLAYIGTRSRVYARQRILHLSTSKGTFSAGLKDIGRGTGLHRQGYKVTCGKDAYVLLWLVLSPTNSFGTIITWLLISRSGYRRANLLFDAHNVAPSARLPRACRRGQ